MVVTNVYRVNSFLVFSFKGTNNMFVGTIDVLVYRSPNAQIPEKFGQLELQFSVLKLFLLQNV